MKLFNILSAGVCLVLSATPCSSDNQERAPFGLSWGMTKAQATATGAILNGFSKQSCGETANATNLPKVLADTQAVSLCFGFDDKLWRIVAKSTDFPHDRNGNQVRARYNELSQLISQRYGKKSENIDSKPYENFFKDPDQYAYALSNKKATCYSNWETDKIFIQLNIGAEYENTYYVSIYEYKPLDIGAKERQRQNEKDAL